MPCITFMLIFSQNMSCLNHCFLRVWINLWCIRICKSYNDGKHAKAPDFRGRLPVLSFRKASCRFWFFEGESLNFFNFFLVFLFSVFTVKDACFFLVSTAPSPKGIAKVFRNHVCFEFACLKVVERNIANRGYP